MNKGVLGVIMPLTCGFGFLFGRSGAVTGGTGVARLRTICGRFQDHADSSRTAGGPVQDVMRDIDTIVKQVRYTGWNETQEGDRTVRMELRKVLNKYGLRPTGLLFDNAYAYIRENY